MYVSMVTTALLLHVAFGALDLTPESERVVEQVARFAVDYTFWLNVAMAGLAVWLVWLHRRFLATEMGGEGMEMPGGGRVKKAAAFGAATLVLVGAGLWLSGG